MIAQQDTFETLADPTRRRIVEALRHGEQQVNDLVVRAGIHQSGVSRHLRILHEAGFVSMRPEGQRRLYSLKPEPFRELDKWLAQYRSLWEKRLDRLEQALEKKRKKSNGPGQEWGKMNNADNRAAAAGANPQLVFERTYRASVQELWEMWTTKEGFESWWPPEGIRAVVHVMEPCLNGRVQYEMIAESPEVLTVMTQLGLPASHREQARFAEFRPMERLVFAIMMDFLPCVAPYEGTLTVDFFPSAEWTRMVVTLSTMHNEEFTMMASEGLASQFRNLDRLFQRRHE